MSRSPRFDSAFDPADASSIQKALADLGHAPNRTMGQNFLIDRTARDRICDIAELSDSDHVLEIGPGLGGLTTELARRAARVSAVEKDPVFAAFLSRKIAPEKFFLVQGDALRVEWGELQLPDAGVKVVANLPYSVSKPLLRKIMEEWRPRLHSFTVMVQREVADRITAAPDTEHYGPMGIMAALYSRSRREFDLPPGAFLPPPNVTSSVVHGEILAAPSIELHDEKFFWRVVHAAFGQRRKQLGNTLRAVQSDRDALQAALSSCSIDPKRRGETLSLQEFANLSHALREPTLKVAETSTQ